MGDLANHGDAAYQETRRKLGEQEDRAQRIDAFLTADERGNLDRLRRSDVRIEGAQSWHVDDRKFAAKVLAVDEMLSALETKHAAAIDGAFLDRRRSDVRRLNLPIETADIELLASGNVKETGPVIAVRRWRDSGKPLLVMAGPPGTGKTLAAARAVLHGGGKYVAARDVARLFLAQFGEESEQARALTETDGVLVIDDIGREKNHEAMQTGLIELLDYRRRDGRRNIWISNLPRAEFEQRYSDERLLSRIKGSGDWFIEASPDMRARARK